MPTGFPNWLSSDWDSEADERRFRYLAGRASVQAEMTPWKATLDSRPDFKLVDHNVRMARGILYDTARSLTSLWSDISISQSGLETSSTKLNWIPHSELNDFDVVLAAGTQALMDRLDERL